MSNPVLVRVPDAVVEEGDPGRRHYWLRQENGNYRPLKSQDLRLHAGYMYGMEAAREIKFKANSLPVSIRFLAGVLPAVYRDGMEEFLVPEFLPIGRLPAADNPPAEFRKLSRSLLKLMEGGQNVSDEARKTRKRMIEIYKEVRQVTTLGCGRSVPINHPWRVLGMNYRAGGFPCDDHTDSFRLTRFAGRRGSDGIIWTSQPYGHDASAIIGFAHQHKLTVTVSMKWGWHYPGKTPLIEWSKPV